MVPCNRLGKSQHSRARPFRRALPRSAHEGSLSRMLIGMGSGKPANPLHERPAGIAVSVVRPTGPACVTEALEEGLQGRRAYAVEEGGHVAPRKSGTFLPVPLRKRVDGVGHPRPVSLLQEVFPGLHVLLHRIGPSLVRTALGHQHAGRAVNVQVPGPRP